MVGFDPAGSGARKIPDSHCHGHSCGSWTHLPAYLQRQATDWKEFYQQAFGYNIDLKSLRYPQPAEGFRRLIMIPGEVTLNQAYKTCGTFLDLENPEWDPETELKVPCRENVKHEPVFLHQRAIQMYLIRDCNLGDEATRALCPCDTAVLPDIMGIRDYFLFAGFWHWLTAGYVDGCGIFSVFRDMEFSEVHGLPEVPMVHFHESDGKVAVLRALRDQRSPHMRGRPVCGRIVTTNAY